MKLLGISFALIALLIAVNVEESNGQSVDCRVAINYRKQYRSYYVRSDRRNTCKESSVGPRRNRNMKPIEVIFWGINIDCAKGNLIISDEYGQTIDYCENQSFNDEIQFFTAAEKVTIQMTGKTNFYLYFMLVDEIPDFYSTTTTNPTNPTNPPTNPTNPPTNPTLNPTNPTNPTINPTNPPTNPPSAPTCGVPVVKPNEMGLKIVGGFEVRKNSWPWQAYITDNSVSCGASLINDEWLITAAHCFTRSSSWDAYLGAHNVRSNDAEARIRISKFIQHENYGNNDYYDIALLKLSQKVKFSSKIQPVCLPEGRTEPQGKTGIVTGWGLEDENSNFGSDVLNQVSISILDNSYCRFIDTSVNICAGELAPAHDACQGDSGGPFVMKDKSTNSFYLAGVVSSGVGCGGKGVYTKVSVFEDWIKTTMAKN